MKYFAILTALFLSGCATFFSPNPAGFKKEEIESVKALLDFSKEFTPIGATVENLKNEYFLVSGSGKFFGNISSCNVARLIKLDFKPFTALELKFDTTYISFNALSKDL